MLIIIILTSLLTITVLVLTAAIYFIQLLTDESDDDFQPDSLAINANDFSTSPNVSPMEVERAFNRRLSSDCENICNNPAHHHPCRLLQSSSSDVNDATTELSREVSNDPIAQQARENELTSNNDQTTGSSLSSQKAETNKLTDSENEQSVFDQSQKQWSSTFASQTQKTLLMNKLGISASKQLFDDFDPKEVQLGGTGLHWCKTRRALYKLINLGLPLGIVNQRKETALHVAARKKKLQILIGLLCHGADVESRNDKGETPLIIAAKCNDIFACQLLLVFDANPNALDKLGHSARHHVSSLCEKRKQSKPHQSLSPSASHLILAMLNEVGAERCPAEEATSSTIKESNSKLLKCHEGCSQRGSYNGNSYNRWPNLSSETLHKRYIFSDLLEREKQIRLIEKERSESVSNSNQSSETKVSRLLCFDGGGMRGIIVCQLMIEMERYLKKPMIDYFDWIGGTSAGAFISSALCTGTSLQQLRRVCFDVKDEVFSGNKPYNAKFLERVLKRTYGPTTRMSAVTNKKIAVTTVLANRDPCQLRIFRNYKSPQEIIRASGLSAEQFNNVTNHSTMNRTVDNKTNDEERVIDEDEQDPIIWQAVRASGAAPFFFKPYGPYLDGGIISNNPTLDMLTEFFNHQKVREFVKKKLRRSGSESSVSNDTKSVTCTSVSEPTSKLGLVVSLGTGRGRVISRQAMVDFGKVTSGFSTVFSPVELVKSIKAARDLFKKLIHQSCQTEDYILDRAQAWCSSLDIPYFRINPPLAAIFSIDDKRDEQLINALWQTKLYMRYMQPQLKELAELLDGVDGGVNKDLFNTSF